MGYYDPRTRQIIDPLHPWFTVAYDDGKGNRGEIFVDDREPGGIYNSETEYRQTIETGR
jgi:hypothetical protein